MGCDKTRWWNEYNSNKLKFYLGYVGEIPAAFDNEQNSLNFLNFLNKKHSSIKFTNKNRVNQFTPFLDIFILGINNQNAILQTYHKSTYTGCLLDFKSFPSYSYKVNLIQYLMNKFVSTETYFIFICKVLTLILLKMRFPFFLVDKVIRRTLVISYPLTLINSKTFWTFIT